MPNKAVMLAEAGIQFKGCEARLMIVVPKVGLEPTRP